MRLIFVEDVSHLSRDKEEAARIEEILQFHGVAIGDRRAAYAGQRSDPIAARRRSHRRVFELRAKRVPDVQGASAALKGCFKGSNDRHDTEPHCDGLHTSRWLIPLVLLTESAGTPSELREPGGRWPCVVAFTFGL